MKRILRWLPFALFVALATYLGVHYTPSPGHVNPVFMMPMASPVAYACRTLQDKLVAYYLKNVATFRTLGSTGLIKWLRSPQNRANFKQINMESIPGKKRGVAFEVDDPFCFNLCAANADCNTEFVQVSPVTREITFDLTNPPFRHCDTEGAPARLQFDEEDLMKYCTETDQSWIQEKIIRYLLRFEEALDKALTTQLATQIGTNAKAEAITRTPIFTSGNTFTPNMSVLNPEAMWYLGQIYNDIGNEGQFALIGGTLVSKIAQFNKWTTANAAGVDMSKVAAINPYPFYDRNFNTTFGQSDLIMLAPGATQLVTWNKYKGEKRRSVTDLYTKATLTLPTTGLEVDYKWFYDFDCEKWTFEVFVHAELATVPAGGCGDDAAGINGIIRVHDCGLQPLVPDCPAGASS